MTKFILKRVCIAITTVFVLATLTFFLMKMIPGDPFLNEKVKPNVQELQRKYYGLDKPVWQQYLTYMGNLLKGDMGTSLTKAGRSVSSIIMETFPVSAKLGLTSLFFAEIIGLGFGMLCAQFRGKWPDYLLMVVAIVGIAMPSMVLGPLLRYYLGVKAKLFPVTGWGTAAQMVLPSIVLGMSTIANTTRSMRASMLSVTTQDYVKTAKAKGLSQPEVVLKHEMKNSMVPILTNMGVSIASVLMGSFVVEQIFLIPGLGKYFVDSISTLDYPVIMGTTIFYGTFLVVMNLIVDILYGLVDPRIRVQ
ncbi:MAG: ABC transporter permease [Fusicatenibacter sp.]|nr:ABC transporter permease [Fusicatenibacter sp.]